MPSEVNLNVNWNDGQASDFRDLHKAISEANTVKYLKTMEKDESVSSSSSGDEIYTSKNDKPSQPPDPEMFKSNYARMGVDSEEEEGDEPKAIGPALLWAAQFGHLDRVADIIDSDKSIVHYQDQDGYNALHRACYSNKTKIVWYLLRNTSINIDCRTNDGWTALHSACQWSTYDCAQLLLAHGCNVNIQTNGGQTPLHLSAAHSESKNITKALLLQPQLDGSLINGQSDKAGDIAKRAIPDSDLLELSADYLTKITDDL